jgi:hypothetical protein
MGYAAQPRGDSMKNLSPVLLTVSLCALLSPPVRAWDATGHEVAARIAWEAMKPQTRARAVALLRAAPPDADLASPLADRQLFERAATWPDIVRDEAFPARREKYHHGSWHYINFFWEPRPGGAPKDRPDLRPDAENAVERLHHFERSLADTRRDPAQRAIDLAWVLHIAADIHQPLHTCARVTPETPEGDHGGNLFLLEGDETLHWYWDQAISRAAEQRPGKQPKDYIGWIAHDLEARHPWLSLRKSLLPGRYEDWVKKGYETCKSVVYPASLRPGEMPSASYSGLTARIAEPAVALAGYRLAAMLDRALRR